MSSHDMPWLGPAHRLRGGNIASLRCCYIAKSQRFNGPRLWRSTGWTDKEDPGNSREPAHQFPAQRSLGAQNLQILPCLTPSPPPTIQLLHHFHSALLVRPSSDVRAHFRSAPSVLAPPPSARPGVNARIQPPPCRHTGIDVQAKY